jgi:hypothetical protein
VPPGIRHPGIRFQKSRGRNHRDEFQQEAAREIASPT